MATINCPVADIMGAQERVSHEALMDGTFDFTGDPVIIDHNASYTAEWTAAIAEEQAGDPMLPGGMTQAQFNAAVQNVPGFGGGSAPAPLYAIWAEENATLANNAYEWSWGNGATGTTIGIPIAVESDLIAVSFNAETFGTSLTMEIHRNGSNQYNASFPSNNSVDTLVSPVRYTVGQRLSFRTGTLVGSFTDARVCAWLREVVT